MLGTIGCLWRVNWELRKHKLMAFVAVCYVGFFLIFVVCQINYAWLTSAVAAFRSGDELPTGSRHTSVIQSVWQHLVAADIITRDLPHAQARR